MPRPKTLSDEAVLDAALRIMQARGPAAVTFAAVAAACGLSSATLVQRFGAKPALVQRTLLHAWDRLDAATEAGAAAVPRTPAGAIRLLVELSVQHGDIERFAEGLLLLREDLSDPALRARGARWKARLAAVLDDCFADVPGRPDGIGLMLAAQWQGALLWWAFDPKTLLETEIEDSLRRFVASLLADSGADGGADGGAPLPRGRGSVI